MKKAIVMIVVHHLNNSRSQRVLWLLEELGLPYEVKRYQRDRQTMLAPPELRAVHPLGKSPVLTDGDLTLVESGAIVEYLVEMYGNADSCATLSPQPGTPAYLRYRYWLHYAEGSLMPPLLLKLVFDKIETSPMPFFVKPIAQAIVTKVKSSFIMPQIATHLDYLETELGKNLWFVDETFSAADVQLSFPLEAAAARDGLGVSRPLLMAFLTRIHARPAYQRALERGGEFSLK